MRLADIFFPGRERLIAIALLGALALGTFWLQSLMRERAQDETGRPLGAPDFVAEKVEVTAFDAAGRPHYHLGAARVTNYPDNAMSRLETPVLRIREETGGETIVTARTGESHRPQGKEPFVILDGQVRVERRMPQQPPLRLDSERLKVWPESERVASEAPVTITQGSQRAQGDKLAASNLFGVLQLAGKVSLALPPASQTSSQTRKTP